MICLTNKAFQRKNALMLYDEGDEYVAATGGWEVVAGYGSKQADYMTGSCLGTYTPMAPRTINAIDVTGYKTLHAICYTETSVANNGVVALVDFELAVVASSYMPTGTYAEITVDISAITGAYKVALYSQYYSVYQSSIYVKKVWLTK